MEFSDSKYEVLHLAIKSNSRHEILIGSQFMLRLRREIGEERCMEHKVRKMSLTIFFDMRYETY